MSSCIATTRSSIYIIGRFASRGTGQENVTPFTAHLIASRAYSVVPSPQVAWECKTPGITIHLASRLLGSSRTNAFINSRHSRFCLPYSDPGFCVGFETSQLALQCFLGDVSPKLPILSLNRMVLTPCDLITFSSNLIPPTVICFARSGLFSDSTESGAARFHTTSIL